MVLLRGLNERRNEHMSRAKNICTYSLDNVRVVIFRIPAWHMLIEDRVGKMLQVFLIKILAWALVEGKCCHKEFESVL